MQPNTITLHVDPANNSTIVDELFKRHEVQINRTTYVGPDHTVASNNMMQLYRTLPKRSGDYLGSAKVSSKFTQTKTVANAAGLDVPAQLIAEVSFSIPVGVVAADMKALRQRIIALLDDDTVTDTFMGIQEI